MDSKVDYRSSGVDVQAGEQAVQAIKDLVRQTYSPDVLSELGSFGGLFRFRQPGLRDPILVASTDGVGTKLRVAIMAQRYDTVGQDLVNHCVNDILVQGALPLFFLDYIGLAKLDQAQVQSIISGMVQACRENSCALIGGEMAEMPGIYRDTDFDLVGTIIGVVDQPDLLPANRIQKGDILVGLPSTGLHTNGFSLARKIVFDIMRLKVDSYVDALGQTVWEALMAVHKSYLPQIAPHLKKEALHGLAHITGGGIPGNLKRVIPDGLTAFLGYQQSEIPPLFSWLQESAGLGWETMLESFNLGIGMIAVMDPAYSAEFMAGNAALVLGEIDESRSGDAKVEFTTRSG